MKIKSLIGKINMANIDIPVFIQNGICGEPRKLQMYEWNGYFDEADKSVTAVVINSKKVVIYYK